MALEVLPIVDGQLSLDQGFLSIKQADALLQQLLAELPWRHDHLTVFGKSHLMPRLHCYQSEQNLNYQYSNLTLQPQSYHAKVLQLKRYLEAVTGQSYNAVLINLYRDGLDKMGWHSDDEPELGNNPSIASISLGAQRCFKLRHRDKSAADIALQLNHGSLLLMAGELQQHWQHCLPIRKKIIQPRINLTFRYLYS
ncbi:MAG: alpha-ketoglutarate-dependent dioxygenase AlkB [Pseudomonadales bacterium]|nr:alpha-ketoglutarate-dependent dioxygenase AlkB [Pseudomonadales bacterium]NRA13907.1 alpha-ketoglutarate-dependent dioxygenase AlkB [Oceanospirillaceae bacterium]